MAELFRSERMTYVRLTMQQESGYETMRHLGAFGKLHLSDLGQGPDGLGTEHSLTYKKRIQDCAGWERKLRDLRELMGQFDVKVPSLDVKPVYEKHPDVIEALKNYLVPREEELNQHIKSRVHNIQLMNSSIERSKVLHAIREQMSGAPPAPSPELEDDQVGLVDAEEGAGQQKFSSNICGVINTARQTMFERMVFRMARGNVLVRFSEIAEPLKDPNTGEDVKKSVFSLIAVGSQLRKRIEKVCSHFGATTYPVPSDINRYGFEIRECEDQLAQYNELYAKTSQRIVKLLSEIAFDNSRLARIGSGSSSYQTFNDDGHQLSPLVNWEHALEVERSICDALRKVAVNYDGEDGEERKSNNSSTLMFAEGWLPYDAMDGLKDALDRAGRGSDQKAILDELEEDDFPTTPPTYFKTNKFTSVFQGIVDTYGVPAYQEVNPGLFTIVTFPFLFGVMYGDIFHGTCLFLFSLLLILNEKKLGKLAEIGELSEIPSMAFGGRYLLVLMGIFGVYCGTIYNDCASIPIDAFGTTWTFDGAHSTSSGEVYPYGIDPSWYHTKNELSFFNSLKMKMSVTLGVTQMSFGIVLSLLNHLHNKNYLRVVFEFIPQIVFMMSTFGYMIFLIIFKLTQDWSVRKDISPPNLIQTMISMFLSPGKVEKDKLLYESQAGVQLLLLVLAFVSVPLMLFPIPLINRSRHLAEQAELAAHGAAGYQHLSAGSDDDDEAIDIRPVVPKKKKAASGGHGHGEYSFSDEFIHQAIHTIEFVLGAVSNTASYLRLWALSLAHAELAGVFWDKMIMQYGVDTGSAVMTVVGMGAWAGATFAVLLCMDVLECFLHALRLHWVEFQNKFFAGSGYAFEPFSLPSSA